MKGTIDQELITRAKGFIEMVGVLKESAAVKGNAGVTAMHDPTDGGILNGTFELSRASGVGIELFTDKVPIANETKVICDFFDVNPLSIYGSGSLLLAVNNESVEEVLNKLVASKIKVSIIGKVIEGEGLYVSSTEGSYHINDSVIDGIVQMLGRKPESKGI